MELVTPGIGLLFWMLLSFLTVIFILRKFAWGPILGALKERETSIENALSSAEKAKQEMAQLHSKNESLLREAQVERERIIKEAKELSDKYISESKERAVTEANKMIESAKQVIQNEKAAAITEIKNIVAELSVDIAEKLIRKEMTSTAEQKALVDKLVGETNLN